MAEETILRYKKKAKVYFWVDTREKIEDFL